jgi:hypothetical protein
MFQALLERRRVEFRYQCLYSGIVAAAVINTRLPADATPLSPYDFGALEDVSTDRERIKTNIISLFAMIPSDASPAYLDALRARTVEKLRAEGHADADVIFEEIFTAWKQENK